MYLYMYMTCTKPMCIKVIQRLCLPLCVGTSCQDDGENGTQERLKVSCFFLSVTDGVAENNSHKVLQVGGVGTSKEVWLPDL